MRAVNPLTQLPGNIQVLEEVEKRVTAGLPFALMYVDLDNFKAFNDHYGFLRGDEVIKLLANLVEEAVRAHNGGFVGHVGGDDFIALVDPHTSEQIADSIISAWDGKVRELYDPGDDEKGYIEVADRRSQMHMFPITTVSIGIASNIHRPIASHWEASEIATEMKQFAKREQASTYAIDRRKQLGAAEASQAPPPPAGVSS
jgi:diguanylate cyclase (GGDEF)-like protein